MNPGTPTDGCGISDNISTMPKPAPTQPILKHLTLKKKMILYVGRYIETSENKL